MTVQRARQKRMEEVTTIDLEYLTLAEAVERLQGLVKVFGGDAKIDSTTDMYSNSDREYLRVMVARDETDAEYTARLAQEEAAYERETKRELEEYNRLQRKFAGKT